MLVSTEFEIYITRMNEVQWGLFKHSYIEEYSMETIVKLTASTVAQTLATTDIKIEDSLIYKTVSIAGYAVVFTPVSNGNRLEQIRKGFRIEHRFRTLEDETPALEKYNDIICAAVLAAGMQTFTAGNKTYLVTKESTKTSEEEFLMAIGELVATGIRALFKTASR